MEWWNVLLPIVTLLLGAVLTEASSERRERRAWVRSRADRLELLEVSRADQRSHFQLDVLMRCHAALGDVARASGRVHHLDVMQARESGLYASHQLPEDASTKLMEASRTLYDVVGLILDDDLRAQVSAAHAAILVPSQQLKSDPEQAEITFTSAVMELHRAQEAVSAHIRDLYGDNQGPTRQDLDRPGL